ncbi:hypothetical protein RMATCC62417_11248 [Rhizopus microsporus]|nr:hypothetical protein RMATCC62417_11248 [Rhizopus microsporus]
MLRPKLMLWPIRFFRWVRGTFKPKETMTTHDPEESPPVLSTSAETFVTTNDDPSSELFKTGMKFLPLSAASSSASLQSKSCVITSPVDTFFTAQGAIESPCQKDLPTIVDIHPLQQKTKPFVPPIVTSFPRRR